MNKVRWHNIASSFRHLHVAGIGLYGDRSLVMPGPVAIVLDESHGPLGDYLRYLDGVGIGAERKLLVPDFYNPGHSALTEIRRQVAAGFQIQFFHTTDVEEKLLRELGLPWQGVYGPTAAVSAYANCKARLRRIGEEIGFANDFPPHRICQTPSEVWQAVKELWVEGQPLIFKVPRLASGDGMRFVSNPAEMEAFCNTYLPHSEVIVEMAYSDHFPVSAQWELYQTGPKMVCATTQIIAPDGLTHLGNVIASRESDLLGINPEEVKEIERLTFPFAKHFFEKGYIGVLGFDLLRNSEGRLFLLESNGRVTATSYALAVGRQLEGRVENWAIAMAIVKPKKTIVDFVGLETAFKDMLFDGRKGFLPFLTRLLPHKIGLMMVGSDTTEALDLLYGVSGFLEV